jgi:hypothetical protein
MKEVGGVPKSQRFIVNFDPAQIVRADANLEAVFAGSQGAHSSP